MIKVDQVSKWFSAHKAAVDGISFEVREGETLVLLGTSGCGKTTSLRMINRLLEPTSGSIYIDGKDIRSQSPEYLRRGIGFVLQDSGLFPHYTVAENVAVVPRLLGWNRRRIAERTAILLEKLHMPPSEYLDAYPSRLSGGQQQRVGLARALAANQPILLMDEPFGALDPITRAHVRKDFRSLDEVRTRTVIMVTHDVSEAFALGDRICLMNEGKIAQWGTPAELLLRPSSEWVRSFFSADRMSLELSVIKVSEVWENLPWNAGQGFDMDASPAQRTDLPATVSLLHALQQALASRTGKICLVSGSARKYATSGDLMDAFHARINQPDVCTSSNPA